LRRDKAKAQQIPGGRVLLPDGQLVAGAKRGGMTDHIAGLHLIPNVGREAMVPAECVRRQRPVKKVVPMPPQQKKQAPVKKKNKQRREHSQSWSRGRSRGAQRGDESESGSGSGSEEDRPRKRTQSEEAEEGRLKERKTEEAKQAEERRQAEEERKLNELAEARRRKQELDEARKKKLGGMFALTEDDIADEENEETKRAREAKERARAEERRLRERQESGRAEDSASSSSALASASARPRLHVSQGDVATALDIDGKLHEHKFSKVWKDWDASKRDDPGEIARQFMKVSAVKRRGYAAPSNRSRSRSRGGRR